MPLPTRRAILAALAATPAPGLGLHGCAAPPADRAKDGGRGGASTGAASRPQTPPPPPPSALVERLRDIATGFDGRFGIAVHDVQAGWTAGYDEAGLYPQQSVAKLWVALAVFDAVDHRRIRLDQVVHVTAADMSVFHQPIRSRLKDGGLDITVDDLLVGAIAQSDNACDDILARLAGGSAAVQRAVDARRLGAIRAGPEEHLLQSRVAGLEWRPEYSVGDAFERARDKLPPALRRQKLAAYLADPPEGASPEALAKAMARLLKGELISPASTARFLAILASTTTGPNRLKGGLPDGWGIAHKTGTGQDLNGLSTGYNDVAIVTAPDGRAYTVAAMMAATSRSIPERMLAMQEVSRAVVAEQQATPLRP